MMGSMKGLIYYENAVVPQRVGIISSHRPVVIVCDKPSGTAVQVVPLTSGNKAQDGYASHVSVTSTGKQSVALCEQVRTVDFTELSRFPKGFCSNEEINNIESALRRLFGFTT